MERCSKGRLRLLEEGLQAQIAELKADLGDKDVSTAAKLGRWVLLKLYKPFQSDYKMEEYLLKCHFVA